MTETGGASGAASPHRRVSLPPTITLPPHSSFDAFNTGLISPGPMTLVSNFFSDHYPDTDLRSFSQLLAGVLPPPIRQNPSAPLHDDCLNDDSRSYDQNLQVDFDINQSISRFSPSGFGSLLQSSFGMLHQLSNVDYVEHEDRQSLLATSEEESRTTQSLDSQIESVDNCTLLSESGNSKLKSVISLTKPASDGYNWRKYGQKQVKASELPRSYYKCTQLNCSVTKKIGHFLDGNVSEIIYNGQHNHDPPLFPKGAKDGAAVHKPKDIDEQVKIETVNEVTTDCHNPKRRKTEVGFSNCASSSRVMVTEPKIMVQTTSEVDILDDGFKWRKYGQKVVKGNIYPRSYYRCTYVGCKVRKHVERAVTDPKSVVTTYEGRHKHDIPVVAKPSHHIEVPILLKLKEDGVVSSYHRCIKLLDRLTF